MRIGYGKESKMQGVPADDTVWKSKPMLPPRSQSDLDCS